MKQVILWTLAALSFAAGYANCLLYADIKYDCASQEFESTTPCATEGS